MVKFTYNTVRTLIFLIMLYCTHTVLDNTCYADDSSHAEIFSPPTLSKTLSTFINFEDGEFSCKFLKSKNQNLIMYQSTGC